MPPVLRRLLPPALSAALALAVAVPVTWSVATSRAAGPDPAPVATGPYDRAELRDELQARLPGRDADGAVLLEASSQIEQAVAFPPGRYRLHLICGLLRRQGDEAEELTLAVDAVVEAWEVVLPCPSTALTLDQELDLTEVPAGGLAVRSERTPDAPASYLLLLRLVPVSGE